MGFQSQQLRGLLLEQVTKLVFVINLKTAKGLGLKIPQTVLIRADEGIQ
jgi:hypothetical protein